MFLRSIHRDILFEGRFKTIRRCVEAAVQEGADLRAVDLRQANLSYANLDGAYMPQACLWGAKLLHTDMSEGNFDGTDFRAAQLKDSCLSASSFRYANFHGAYFSAVIVSDADMSYARFSCPSFFSLSLAELSSISGSIYSHLGQTDCEMSSPPLVIKGFPQIFVCFERHILYGSKLLDVLRPPGEIERFINDLRHELGHNHSAFKDIFCNLIKGYNPKIERAAEGA